MQNAEITNKQLSNVNTVVKICETDEQFIHVGTPLFKSSDNTINTKTGDFFGIVAYTGETTFYDKLNPMMCDMTVATSGDMIRLKLNATAAMTPLEIGDDVRLNMIENGGDNTTKIGSVVAVDGDEFEKLVEVLLK